MASIAIPHKMQKDQKNRIAVANHYIEPSVKKENATWKGNKSTMFLILSTGDLQITQNKERLANTNLCDTDVAKAISPLCFNEAEGQKRR